MLKLFSLIGALLAYILTEKFVIKLDEAQYYDTIFEISPWIAISGFVILLVSPKPMNKNYDFSDENKSKS